MEKAFRRFAFLAMLGAIPAWSQTSPPLIDPAAQQALVDSLTRSLDDLEGIARKSILNGSSKPVSFSGEALMRFIGTSYDQYPEWMSTDRTETKNSVVSARVAMVVAPHRNLRLWSKIAFNGSLMGTNKAVTDSNGTRTPQTGYFDPHSNNLYEDMCAGLTAAIGKATTSFKLGGVLWTEASPLTVWKGQNRMFGWDYLPYELEQSSAQYYEYATSKGEKAGRAAWNKKAFQGVQWESVDLPGKLYFNLTYGYAEGFLKFQPNYIASQNTNGLMYTDKDVVNVGSGLRTFASKGDGTYDNYRRTFVARVARQEIPLPDGQALPIQVGFNYVNYHTDNDYGKQYYWAADWGGLSPYYSSVGYMPVYAFGSRDSTYKANYFLSYQVASVDFRQNVPGKVNFLVDIGASQIDTSYFEVNKSKDAARWKFYHGAADSATIVNADSFSVVGHKTSNVTPAVYAQVSNLISGTVGTDLPLDLGVQAIYAPKNFYSGTSFITPQDAFFPFEANLTGAGKFAGADNGTPYVSNEMGANFTFKYTGLANGHLRVNAGYHTQIENGSDILWIPWRLNGTAFKESQNQSSSQYDGQGLTDDYIRDNPTYTTDGKAYGPSTPGRLRQIRRFANDFYFFKNRENPYSLTLGTAGGIRNDFLSTFEAFGLFRKRAGNTADTAAINEMIADGNMPQSKKATQNISFDYGKDISRLWKGKRPMFLGFYAAVNGVSSGGLPLPSDDNTYLSGYILRFEPVYQVADKFWIIGLVGQEQWYSRYGVAAIDASTGNAPSTDAGWANPANWHKAPIDYLDRVYGGGFDWGISSRVELHTRLEYFTHKDRGISAEVASAAGKNDYEAWLLHAETKMWF